MLTNPVASARASYTMIPALKKSHKLPKIFTFHFNSFITFHVSHFTIPLASFLYRSHHSYLFILIITVIYLNSYLFIGYSLGNIINQEHFLPDQEALQFLDYLIIS